MMIHTELQKLYTDPSTNLVVRYRYPQILAAMKEEVRPALMHPYAVANPSPPHNSSRIPRATRGAANENKSRRSPSLAASLSADEYEYDSYSCVNEDFFHTFLSEGTPDSLKSSRILDPPSPAQSPGLMPCKSTHPAASLNVFPLPTNTSPLSFSPLAEDEDDTFAPLDHFVVPGIFASSTIGGIFGGYGGYEGLSAVCSPGACDMDYSSTFVGEI